MVNKSTFGSIQKGGNHNSCYHSYKDAMYRCRNPKNKYYHRYGGRGIKFLMSYEDFVYLWRRDKAYLMKKPSIDRKNNDGNYFIGNCQFIELSENVKKMHKDKKKKLE